MSIISFEILLVTSSVGALQSTFFGSYLVTLKKGNTLANRALALLLFALALRMTKSVSYYFAEGHDIPWLFQNIGYASHLSIFPFLLLYIKSFLDRDYRFSWTKDGFHLVPALIIVILSPYLTPKFWLLQHGYTFSLLLMSTYIPFCFIVIKKRINSLTTLIEKKWIISITAGIAVVWAAYAANFLLGLVPYITAPVIFSIVMYYLAYTGLRHHYIFIKEEKYKNSVFSTEDIESCFSALGIVMMAEKTFKDPGLTLPRMAKKLGVSPNLLSQVINEKRKQNFPEFINSYRIKEACSLLSDPGLANQKIASIAFDTGFNTLSAFNNAFKKFTETTPSEFRKKMLLRKEKSA